MAEDHSEQQNNYEKLGINFSQLQNNLLLKIVIIIIAICLLQIPLYMIKTLNKSRENNNDTVKQEIYNNWGNKGAISTFRADAVKINAVINPEVRYRGIYQVVIYTADVNIDIDYNNTTEAAKEESITFAYDRGIMDIGVKINDKPINVTLSDAKLRIPMPVGKSHCEVTIKLRGSEVLQFFPDSPQSQVTITGNWDSPSFVGSQLPASRTIEKDKFTAQWDFGAFDTSLLKAGVELCLPAGIYQQIDRCFKYATFFLIVFFFTLLVGERLTKVNIHILQYLIASGAPVLFYLMTLSFAEKIGFTLAYITSATIIVAMVTMYSRMFWNKTRPALILGIILAVSYIFNFFVIRMEDFAMLTGTIILAIILGFLMAITGKINQK